MCTAMRYLTFTQTDDVTIHGDEGEKLEIIDYEMDFGDDFQVGAAGGAQHPLRWEWRSEERRGEMQR